MILDALTHVTPDGTWFHTSYDASEARLLREMDRHDVQRAVVVALADVIENDFVSQVCLRHPDRLVPGASFNPARFPTPSAALEAFRRSVSPDAFRVLKLHPRLNHYDPLDDRCLAILDYLEAQPAPTPVWICSRLYHRGGTFRKAPVDTLYELANRYRHLPLIFAHGGGAWTLQLAEAIRDAPNVYLDLSMTLTQYAGSSVTLDLAHLMRTFDRRMLFGSDFPEAGLGEALAAFEQIAQGVAAEKRANVLGRNLAGLLAAAPGG